MEKLVIPNYLLKDQAGGTYAATLWRLMRQTRKAKGHDENLQMIKTLPLNIMSTLY